MVTYTLSYENIGGVQATGVTMRDTIPVSTTYVDGSLAINTGSGWVALTDGDDADQGAFISPTLVIAPGLSPGTIASGETGHIRFSVKLDDDLPVGSLILNWATLDRDLDIPRDSNMVVTRRSDLLISKSAEQAVVAPGGVISYSLTYENSSQTVPQTNVYVREAIPDHTTFITATGVVSYSCDHGATWSATQPITPVTHIRWYDAQLPAGTQETVGFAVRVNDPLLEGTTVRNTALISSTETGGYLHEWIPSNEVEVATVDLWVEKSVSQPSARAGDPISYTIAYGNHGSADAFGVQITDALPPGTSYSPGTIWGTGADDSADPTLVWDVMTVKAGAGVRHVGYTVVLDSGLLSGALVTNTASVGSVHGVKVSAPVTVAITTEADLAIVKLDNPGTVTAGQTLTYTLVYTNNGPSDAQEVAITDTLPVSVTLEGVVSSQFPDPSQSGRQVTWLTPTLAAGDWGSIVFTVTVGADADSTITNSVTITSSTLDLDPANNGDDEQTTVEPPLASLIYGTVFEDADGDGEWDAGEVGIPGVAVRLYDNVMSVADQPGHYTLATTDLHGNYAFSTTVKGIHTLVEVDPSGYLSTTPNQVDVDVQLGNDHQVNFGDVPESGSPVCSSDGYEEDDMVGLAAGLRIGVTQAHNFCYDATDWVAFTATAQAVYTITALSWGQRTDTFLALFGTDGQTLLAANDDYEGATDHSSRIVWEAPADGVYYVRITNQAGLTGKDTTYDLLIQEREPFLIYLPIVMRNHSVVESGNVSAPQGVINHICPDSYELDDTWQQADTIEAEIMQMRTFDSDPQRYAADKDIIWFDASAGDIMTLTVTPMADIQVSMALHDENRAALNVTGTTLLVWTVPADGHYYLVLQPGDGTTAYGCANVAGYQLYLEMVRMRKIFLPVVMRNE